MGTPAESVRNNGSQLDVGNRETVLEAVLFTGHKAGQLVTAAHEVTELPDVSGRHKAAGNKIMLEQVSDPFRIFLVSFLTADSLNIFGMGKDNGTINFQNVVNMNSVFIRKIRAQNSKHNCITQSGLDRKIEYAEAQINAYLMAIEKEDTDDDNFKEKLQMYQNLKEQYLEQKQELKAEGLEQKSLTDTDSRRMKNNGSLDICYNVQSVVDFQNHFVIDISTTNDINDQNQLYVMAKDAAELLDIKTPTIVADTGYYNGTEIKSCIDDGMSVLIKRAKENNSTKDNEFRKEKFSYDKEHDVYVCPAGNELSFLKTLLRTE